MSEEEFQKRYPLTYYALVYKPLEQPKQEKNYGEM